MQFPLVPLAPFVFGLFPESQMEGLQILHSLTGMMGVAVGAAGCLGYLLTMNVSEGWARREDAKLALRFLGIAVAFAFGGAYLLPLVAIWVISLLWEAFREVLNSPSS